MRPDSTTPPKDQSQKVDKALEFLDDTVDKTLARGDDDFYEAFKAKRNPDNQHQSKPRKRGKRI
ncbi:MAG: hypothetical protein J0L67_04250 [Cytophagales bacterium]|nr:hypothetical protein [Cytophagales bacterium]